jgi:hypothetical protein
MTPQLTATPNALEAAYGQLRREYEMVVAEVRLLELQVRKLKQELWGKKSERYVADPNLQPGLFAEPTPVKPAAETRPASAQPAVPRVARKIPMGPKPLDPALPREVIQLPAPDLKALICPETKQPMQPGFVDHLEVLARKPAEYYVKRYERTVFVSPAKTAPVATEWPADVLPRARMHASVVAHVAAAHYADHLPYYRIEQQLARTGVASRKT